ncbi:MAG: DUF1194 domain-containing protein [Pseudomonadota bacterium]|nr:DUF1194 domain-containing protein [Pseudomonadota bacterium]
MRNLCRAVALGVALAAAPAATGGAARACALELVIAVDVSGSIDSQTYALQMQGYASAFRDKDVQRAISALGPGGIAVALLQWGSTAEQDRTIAWSRVTDRTSAEALAAVIEHAPRRFSHTGTAIGAALAFAAGQFEAGGLRCGRRVIDISGDGRSNAGPEPSGVRDAVVLAGITINGLPITDIDRALDAYYADSVVGGEGAFVMIAENYADISVTIRKKLLRELSPRISATPSDDRLAAHGAAMHPR